MNRVEYEFLSKHKGDKIFPAEYSPMSKTLLYGYDCDRNTWHFYVVANEYEERFHNVIYSYPDILIAHKDYSAIIPQQHYPDIIPNKRLYPEGCDYRFCRMLKECGVDLPFTVYGTMNSCSDEFIGYLKEDLRETE